MIKYNTLIFFIIILLIVIFFYFNNNQELNNYICINSTCFEVEIADSSKERQIGLMHREFLHEKKGMLFIFEEEDIYPFWMKDTLIPLDIIWIDSEKEIEYIEHSAQPCLQDICVSYNPESSAKYVLEINSGLAKKYNFNKRDKFNFKVKQ